METKLTEKTYTMYVKGIYCAQCPEIIISALLQKKGVIDADVIYFQSRVTVKFDPHIISIESINTYLDEIGYTPVSRKPLLSERLLDRIAHTVYRKNG